MADNDLQLSFGADTGDLKAGVADVRALVAGLRSDLAGLTSALGAMSGALQAAFRSPNVSGVTGAFGQIADAAKAMEAAVSTAAVGGTRTIDADTRATAARVTAEWNRSVGAIVGDFGQGLLKVAQGAETWQKFSNRLLGQIESKAVASVAKMVSNWIYGEMAKTSATAAGVQTRGAVETTAAAQSRALSFADTEKQTFNNALKAASAAYSAMAGVPIIGPALGAGAAAVTFTAVEAFGQMASAAGGYDIPAGVNPITQLHQNEMVLPSQIAQPLKRMMADYAAGGAGGTAGATTGDTHHHYNGDLNISALDGASVYRTLIDNRTHVQRAIGDMVRGGMAAKMGLATS